MVDSVSNKPNLLKLSVSSLKTYETCPRKYYFSYIEKPKIPEKDWAHLTVGNFVHEVLEEFHNILKEDKAKDRKKLMTFACQSKEKEKKGAGLKFKLDETMRKEIKEMLFAYLSYIDQKGIPNVEANEKKFNIYLDEDLLIRGVIDRVDIGVGDASDMYHLVDYKGLAVDTPIPTPSGWTTMGELKVGDKVFGSDGQLTSVTLKSGVHNRECYKITLSDGEEIVCDNVHLWNVGYRASGYNKNYDKTVSTEELYALFGSHRDRGEGSFIINNSKALNLPEVELPTSPWLLGAWLGDKTSLLVDGKSLESLPLNNYIPQQYLRASFSQRVSLLQGLMDTSGSWNSKRKVCTFITTDEKLFNQAVELIRTFGLTVQAHRTINKLSDFSFKAEFKPAGIAPFKLNWKACQAVEAAEGACNSVFGKRRKITSIDKVDSVPTQCIGVDAEDELYLCGKGFVPSHNTGKSKYLDEFQLLVYGIPLLQDNPDIQEYKASYIALKENMKEISYTFTKTDVERVKEKIRAVARQIREDTTWEPRPQFLCNYCDYESLCDASPKKRLSQFVKGGEIEWA